MIKQYFFHQKAFKIFYEDGRGGSFNATFRFIGVLRHNFPNHIIRHIARNIDDANVYSTLMPISRILKEIK